MPGATSEGLSSWIRLQRRFRIGVGGTTPWLASFAALQVSYAGQRPGASHSRSRYPKYRCTPGLCPAAAATPHATTIAIARAEGSGAAQRSRRRGRVSAPTVPAPRVRPATPRQAMMEPEVLTSERRRGPRARTVEIVSRPAPKGNGEGDPGCRPPKVPDVSTPEG
jgi:hypothetical protein